MKKNSLIEVEPINEVLDIPKLTRRNSLPIFISKEERDNFYKMTKTWIIRKNWKELGKDLTSQIFCFLLYEDVVSVSQVCKLWNEASKEKLVWYNLLSYYEKKTS